MMDEGWARQGRETRWADQGSIGQGMVGWQGWAKQGNAGQG